MKLVKLISEIEKNQIKKDLPKVNVGDNVKIGIVIQEGNKQRIQPYEGTILAKTSSGVHTSITVRRIFQGVSIERIFLIHSPAIQTIEVLRSSSVRRSKLYYLQNRIGKDSRLIQKFVK